MGVTFGTVWDACHEWYGVGGDLRKETWTKMRMGAIAALKNKATSAQLSPEEVMVCLEYAKAHNERVKSAVWLISFAPDARKWQQLRRQAEEDLELDRLIARAIDEESLKDPDGEWLLRLVRASGEFRRQVYEEWKSGQA